MARHHNFLHRQLLLLQAGAEPLTDEARAARRG